MMDDSFDPYLQWLGIRDAQRPPNHYRLMGVGPLESDVDVIASAADRQMAHVRTFQGGKHSAISQRVLNELAKARVCLLDAERKAEYDKELSQKLAAAQASAANQPAAKMPPMPAKKASGGDFVGVAVGSTISRAGSTGSGAGSTADRDGRPASKQINKTLLLTAGISALGLAIIVAVVVAVYVGRPDPTMVNVDPIDDGPDPGAPTKTVKTMKSFPKTKTDLVIDPPQRKDVPDPPNEIVNVTPYVEWPFQPRKQAEPPDREAPPLKLSGAVLKPLRAARTAMQQRDLDKADLQIEAAATAAAATIEKDEVERHREIHRMLKSYWNAVSVGLAKAKAGDKLTYREGEVTLVSKDDDQLTLQAKNGAKKSFESNATKVDLDLAHALAQDRLDVMGPVGLAALGAAEAMDRQVNIDRARQLWKQAHDRGIPVSYFVAEAKFDFAKLVADTTPVPQVRKPLPSHAELDKARAQVNDSFRLTSPEVRKLNPDGRMRLADRLLEQARSASNRLAVQYVAFLEARRQFERADALEEALAAVDELSQVFEVDPWVEKQNTIKKLTKTMAAESKTHQLLFETMTQLAYEAALAKQFKVARGLVPSSSRIRSIGIERLRKEAVMLRKAIGALEKLDEKGGAPSDHLAIGKFQSLVQDDWDRGLKHLAKASDEALREIVDGELASPTTREAQLALGDAWWNLAKKRNKSIGTDYAIYARGQMAHWYETVGSPYGNDLQAAERKTRLEAFENDWKIYSGPTGSSKPIDLLALGKKGRAKIELGKWENDANGVLFCNVPDKGYPALMFDVAPRSDRAYQMQIVFEKIPTKKWAGYLTVCLPTPGSFCALTVDCAEGVSKHNGIMMSPKNGVPVLGGIANAPNANRTHTLDLIVQPKPGGLITISASVDGKPVANWTGPQTAIRGAKESHVVSNPRNVGIVVAAGGMKFHKAIYSEIKIKRGR